MRQGQRHRGSRGKRARGWAPSARRKPSRCEKPRKHAQQRRTAATSAPERPGRAAFRTAAGNRASASHGDVGDHRCNDDRADAFHRDRAQDDLGHEEGAGDRRVVGGRESPPPRRRPPAAASAPPAGARHSPAGEGRSARGELHHRPLPADRAAAGDALTSEEALRVSVCFRSLNASIAERRWPPCSRRSISAPSHGAPRRGAGRRPGRRSRV